MPLVLPSFAGTSQPSAAGYSNNFSVELDGTNEYIDYGSPGIFNFGTSNLTLSTWFKPTAYAGSFVMLLSSHTTGAEWGLFIDSSNNYKFYAGGGFYTGSGINLNAWNHGMVVRDSTNINIYLNGVKKSVGSIGSGTSITMGGSGVGTGSKPGLANDRYEGFVDEFAVWQSAISDGGVSAGATAQGDIATIYNSGIPHDLDTLSTKPNAWWRMGESDSGTGSTVTDVGQGVGGTKQNATLNNGAAFTTDVPS